MMDDDNDDNDDVDDDDDIVAQELWRIVVHTLEKSVVLPPLADPRAVRQTITCQFHCVFLIRPVADLGVGRSHGPSSPRQPSVWYAA